MTDPRPPEFIQPANVSELTDEQLDELIEGIRLRRMQKLVVYAETQKLKHVAELAKIEALYDKKMGQFSKQLTQVDKALEKLEKYTNEIRGLRLQLGVDPL
jgi:hypothetical protein